MSVLDTLFRSTKSEFSLANYLDFPYNEYARNCARYDEETLWFTGEVLSESTKIGSSLVEKYPLRFNPIYNVVMKHAFALFGEFGDDDDMLVVPKVRRSDGSTDAETERAEAALNQMWSENNAAALQFENGILSQVHGGCVFRLAYDPTDDLRETKIRIENPHPREFVGVPMDADYWTQRESWLIREISKKTAEQYKVKLDRDKGYYIEHWLPDRFEIMIDDVPVGIPIGDKYYQLGGANPFSVVPIVYIPHVRSGAFLGDSLIRESLKGLIRELNARLADAGDAISDDTHVYGVMKNVRGTPQVREIAPGKRVIDLGHMAAFSGDGFEPSLEFPEQQRASEPVLRLNEILYNLIRRETSVPAVADGEDEGSQRSSLTLTTRMWPLVSHVKMERAMWSTGMRALNRIALRMMAEKGILGITEEHAKMRISSRWSPVLPRDREALVNELVTRAAGNLGSIDHLLEMTGDVDNIELEKQRILEWIRAVMEVEADVQRETLELQIEAQAEMAEAQMENDQELADKSARNSQELAKTQAKNMQSPAKTQAGTQKNNSPKAAGSRPASSRK